MLLSGLRHDTRNTPPVLSVIIFIKKPNFMEIIPLLLLLLPLLPTTTTTKTTFKVRFGTVQGVLLELVLCVSVLNVLLTIWALRNIVLELHDGINEIDAKIAGALQSLVERGLGDIEPINPIQQAIAQMLSARMQEAPISVQARRPDGKFGPDEVS